MGSEAVPWKILVLEPMLGWVDPPMVYCFEPKIYNGKSGLAFEFFYFFSIESSVSAFIFLTVAPINVNLSKIVVPTPFWHLLSVRQSR